MSKFTYKSRYGTYKDCHFQVGRYAENNNLAITIMSPLEGPIVKVTINPSVKLPDSQIAIKNYSENEGMVDFLISQKIINPIPVAEFNIGVVNIPIHELTSKGKKMVAGDED